MTSLTDAGGASARDNLGEVPGEGRRSSQTKSRIDRYEGGAARARWDVLATEEPLEIRLGDRGKRDPLSVTMRTPGADFELVAGWLLTEGVICARSDIRSISYCVDRSIGEEQRYNIVNVELAAGERLDAKVARRFSYVSSACGVCGKASLEELRMSGIKAPAPGPRVTTEVIGSLPARLRAAQGVFDRTGGLHAAGLFDARGDLVCAREDVGRHNALDKLIGWALLNDELPLSDRIVLVSGRASFELVHKSLAAGLSVLCAVSAPSSLAVDAAAAFSMTLIGFLRGDRFNAYSGFERIARPGGSESATAEVNV